MGVPENFFVVVMSVAVCPILAILQFFVFFAPSSSPLERVAMVDEGEMSA